MTKKEKENNFLQIYYYRRAAACYPYKIGEKEKNKEKTNTFSWLKKLFQRKNKNG